MSSTFMVSKTARRLGIANPVIAVVDGVAPVASLGTSLDGAIAAAMSEFDKISSSAEVTAAATGFRNLFDELGYPNQPTAYEKLRDQIRLKGFKRINAIVDAYNLASLRFGTPLGAHDTAAAAGTIRITRTTQPERIRPMFLEKDKTIPVGDLVYHDSRAIMCWMGRRDVDAHAYRITETTRSVLLMAIGNAHTETNYNERVCACAYQLMKLVFPLATLRVLYPRFE